MTARRGGAGGGALAGAVAARVDAQAKINLFLRVLAREASGYHQLETLFARLDLADRIVVRVREGGGRSIDCAGPALDSDAIGPAEANLGSRAAVAYAEEAAWPGGFAIEIEKQVPVGGGLGGGSADAGGVLRALNALNPTPLPQHRLFAVAAALGADVPFLTAEAPLALAWGRGERMLAFPALPPRHAALLRPPFGVATPDAFAWLSEARAGESASDGRQTPQPRMIFPHQFLEWESVYRLVTNEFEPVVGARHPEIGAAREALISAGARAARMSGSGSTVFGLFDEAPDAAALERASGCKALITRTAARVVGVRPED